MVLRESLPVAIGHFRETSYVHVVFQVGKLYHKLYRATGCEAARSSTAIFRQIRQPILYESTSKVI